MLTITGTKGEAFCDGMTRRGFLRIGALGMGGAALPQILQAESGPRSKPLDHKAVIMIFLAGGPPHQDMWDLKMEAPSGVRGEFKPISTNVPGIQICELFPQMAKMMESMDPDTLTKEAESMGHQGVTPEMVRSSDESPVVFFPTVFLTSSTSFVCRQSRLSWFATAQQTTTDSSNNTDWSSKCELSIGSAAAYFPKTQLLTAKSTNHRNY